MKRSKIYFLLRSVYKNITYAKVRSLFLLLTFTLLFSFLLTGASLKSVLATYYIDKYKQNYGEIDLVMSIGQQSTSRYFSFRQLEENGLSEEAYPIFEVLMTHETSYHKVILGNNQTINYITNQSTPVLGDESIIVSTSFGKRHNYKIGDAITLNFGGTSYTYQIAFIADATGQFDQDSFLVNHIGNIKKVISKLVPSLSGFNQLFFSNLYNKVFFETPDVKTLTASIKSLSDYENFEFKTTMPLDYIHQQVNRSVSLYLMIFLFISLALILLIQTLITFRFSAYQKDFAIYSLHGFTPVFSLSILASEFIFIALLSSIMAYPLSYVIINFGLKQLGSDITYKPLILHALLVFVLFATILLMTVCYDYLSLRKKSIISHTKPQMSKSHLVFYVFIFTVSMFSYLFIEKDSGLKALIILLILPVLLYAVLKIALSLLYKIRFKNLLGLSIKGMLMGKRLVSYLVIGLICSLSILLLIQTQSYMSRKKDLIIKEYKANIVLSGIFGNMTSVKAEVSNMPNVIAVTEFGHFESITILEYNQVFQSVYDIDPAKISVFFDLNVESQTINDFSQTVEPSIMLPMRYNVLFNLQKGDEIKLSLNDDISFKVCGFFEHSVGNIAFVNINKTVHKNDFQSKSLIIVSSEKVEAITTLKNTFSNRFYNVIDFKERTDVLASEINKALSYASFISVIIILALFVALLNQGYMLYDSLTHTYSLLTIFGKSKESLKWHMALEILVVNLVYISISFLGISLINPLLKPLLLLFGEYEKIKFAISDLPLAITIICLMSFAQSFAYVMCLHRLKVENALKMNENA